MPAATCSPPARLRQRRGGFPLAVFTSAGAFPIQRRRLLQTMTGAWRFDDGDGAPRPAPCVSVATRGRPTDCRTRQLYGLNEGQGCSMRHRALLRSLVRAIVAAILGISVGCGATDPAREEAERVRGAASPNTTAASDITVEQGTSELVRGFQWSVDVSGDWRGYAVSVTRRLPGYHVVSLSDSCAQFSRLSPGDEYDLRLERVDDRGHTVARLVSMPR